LNEISTKERLLGGCGLSKINRRKKIDHLKTIDFLEIYNLDIMNNRTFLVLQGKCEVITGEDTTIYHTLTQLHPETSYDVEVVATNRFGTSNTSLKLTTVCKLH
jgi:hypothetical protein